MPATTVKSARKRLGDLVREVNDDTVAVEIVGKRDNAVLISYSRYVALREATFLLRSPELMESLRREAARSLRSQQPPTPTATVPAAPVKKAKRGGNRKKRKK